MIGCLFDPLGCVQGVVTDWFAALPWWGWVGIGMVLGAMLGKWGVAAVFGVLALLRFMPRQADEPDPLARTLGMDGLPPAPRAKPKRRRFNPDTGTLEDF